MPRLEAKLSSSSIQGKGSTVRSCGFCDFIYGAGAATACAPSATGPGLFPPNKTIPAARSYDGLELRLIKAPATIGLECSPTPTATSVATTPA